MIGKRRRRSSSHSNRSSRRYKEPSLWEQFDWHIDVKTSKEILALILVLIGLIFILAIFKLAGPVGSTALNIFKNLWGYWGYIFPLAFLLIGINLFRNRDEDVLRASITIGIIGAFLCIPAIAPAIGGNLGLSFSNLFKSFLGDIGGTVVVLILSIIFLLIAFNTNFGQLIERWKNASEDDETDEESRPLPPQVKINEPKAPVFVAGKPKPEQLLKETPKPQPSLFDQNSDKVWEYPSPELLEYSNSKAESGNIPKNVGLIEKTLREFNIEVVMDEVNVGPTVTQYTLKPSEGVKLNQITARTNDVALALAAKSIRVEAPIPGKSAVGIEIPNIKGATVTLRSLIEDNIFVKSKSNLMLPLGLDVAGQPVCFDLKTMPHLLVAGSTGSGKSVCINSIITSLLYRNSPVEMRIILVDPKRVEFTEYNGIPHLLTPVVTEVDKTVNVLKWAVSEMDRRFKVFAEHSRRNIDSYNDNPPGGQKMPYLVIIIDELADLMAQAANEVEGSIVRLAQMARAVGIHLIVATQRPSVDVITGLIKANMPTRIAFAVASQVDSRTIIDQSGAEKLLGKGDMLYLGSEVGSPKRIQGVFIVDKEIKAITDFLKRDGHTMYDMSILESKGSSSSGSASGSEDMEYNDDMYQQAKEVVIQAGKASASLLQRRLRIGYARAARILDLLEADGVIGPADGSKPRDVLAINFEGSNYE